MKLNLRKMITVSAAALMLAGVGASATNAGEPVHASRRTVRMSSLRIHENRLNRQIKSDQSQVKKIKREIARLSPKSVKKGKRSKKNVNRNKRAKKHVKKSGQSHAKTAKRNSKQQPKVTTYRTHIGMNNKVYTAEVVAKGKIGQIVPGTVRYVSTMKTYAKKYTKPFLAARNAVNTNMIQFKKTHNMKYYKNALKANQSLRSMAVMSVNAGQPAKK